MKADGFTIAIYLRLSEEDRDRNRRGKTESNSIANQRDLLSDFISRMPEFEGAKVMEFCDDGFSGKNFERPAVREMLEQVRQGKIQCIIVKDISRFGRDYLTVGNYLSRVFPFLGVRFIAVGDGFDSSRLMDIDSLETSFRTLLYDLYSRDLSRKVRDAQQFKAKRGDYISSFPPFGYQKDPDDKNHLIIDEKASEIVRDIFHMAAGGLSTTQIARIMNEQQFPTPMQYKLAAGCSRTKWHCIREDNFWTHDTIIKILRDERYIGKNIFGKRTLAGIGSAHSVKVSRKDWIVVDNTHEAIVTKEEFERAQKQIRELAERNAGQSSKRKTPFSKKIRCGVCGHAMIRMKGRNPYYSCPTPRVTDLYSCPTEQIPEEELMEVVLKELRMLAACTVEVSHIGKEKSRIIKNRADAIQIDITKLKESYAGLENSMRELYENYVFGELNQTEYISVKKSLMEKKAGIAAKIQAHKAELNNICADESASNQCADKSRQYADIEALTAEMLSDVLQEIIIYPDKRIYIVWNFTNFF